MTHTCPVCQYAGLVAPPLDHTICPACGTQFGWDDTLWTVAELRARWLAGGALWWSEDEPEPMDWRGAAGRLT